MIYLTLFYEFFKTGLFSIGGGLATIPFLYDMAEKFTWFSKERMGDMIAISESTPGPIGVNMATYAGFHAAGILGGITATVGLVFPSVIVIILIYKMLDRFKNSAFRKHIFYGIRPAVTGMIAAAGLGMMKLSVVDWKTAVMFLILLFCTNKFKKHPAFYILLAGLAGGIFT